MEKIGRQAQEAEWETKAVGKKHWKVKSGAEELTGL